MWNPAPIWRHFDIALPPSEDLSHVAGIGSAIDHDIFEPDGARVWREGRPLARGSSSPSRYPEPPPAYIPLTHGDSLVAGTPPPSFDAAHVDRASLRMSKGMVNQQYKGQDVLDYLAAIGRLIETQGGSQEVIDRLGPLTAAPLVAKMSGLLQLPFEANHSGQVMLSSSHVIAVQYCALLAALVGQSLLDPDMVMRCLESPRQECPLLLSLASASRPFPQVGHVMCDLMKAILHGSHHRNARDDLRGRLLTLQDLRGTHSKYDNFCGRLVESGALSKKEAGGALVVIQRLRALGIWPSSGEIEIEHRSRTRASKHQRSMWASGFAILSPDFGAAWHHRMPSLQEVGTKLSQQIRHAERLAWTPVERSNSSDQATAL